MHLKRGVFTKALKMNLNLKAAGRYCGNKVNQSTSLITELYQLIDYPTKKQNLHSTYTRNTQPDICKIPCMPQKDWKAMKKMADTEQNISFRCRFNSRLNELTTVSNLILDIWWFCWRWQDQYPLGPLWRLHEVAWTIMEVDGDPRWSLTGNRR